MAKSVNKVISDSVWVLTYDVSVLSDDGLGTYYTYGNFFHSAYKRKPSANEMMKILDKSKGYDTKVTFENAFKLCYEGHLFWGAFLFMLSENPSKLIDLSRHLNWLKASSKA